MTRIYAIALNTFRESVRSKIVYSLFFFAAVLLGVSTFFGAVTIGDQVKVIKDFGLFSISFFTVAYAVIAGAALLQKELARKTIYNILAKPVSRADFLIGKYVGMLMTVALMLVLMGAVLSLYIWFFDRQLDLPMLQAYLFIFFQLIIVCAAAIFFSTMVATPMLSGAFTFGIFLAGRSTEYLLYFIKNGSIRGAGETALKSVYWLLPHLNWLEFGNEAVYGAAASSMRILFGSLYACAYAGILLILAVVIFRSREFN
jgi:Cu-processing system permease protein